MHIDTEGIFCAGPSTRIPNKDKSYEPHDLMGCIMGCDYSLDQNDILKFVYCFMTIFLIYL
jgi:hypothetical protein